MLYEGDSWLHLYRFESLHDFATHVRPAYERNHSTLRGMFDRKIWGYSPLTGRTIHNIRHAFQLAETEWPEGLQMAEDLMNEVKDHEFERPVTIRRTARWSEDHGDDFSLDRYMSGQEYWRTTERQYRAGPMNITIAINNSAPQLSNHSVMTWRGIAAVILAELLEAAGYRTDIYSAFYGQNSYNDRGSYGQIINLKHSEDPIDRSTLTNVLSGWFFRTCCIPAIMLREGDWLYPNKFGEATSISSWIKRRLNDPRAVTADMITNKYSAIKWIQDSLDQLTKPPAPPEPPAPVPVAAVTSPPRKWTKKDQADFDRLMKRLSKEREL